MLSDKLEEFEKLLVTLEKGTPVKMTVDNKVVGGHTWRGYKRESFFLRVYLYEWGDIPRCWSFPLPFDLRVEHNKVILDYRLKSWVELTDADLLEELEQDIEYATPEEQQNQHRLLNKKVTLLFGE